MKTISKSELQQLFIYPSLSEMILKCALCVMLLVAVRAVLIECRSYNNGLIFYNLENHNSYLPPTISVSRGRGLAKFKYSARGSIWSTFGKPCECKDALCGCCVGINVKQYNFDQKMCANVSYARPRDEIQLEVFLNDTATAKYGISARNPSPLCVPIMMGIPMSMCIQMSNIGVQGDNLNMCMDFLVRLASTEIFEMHFQCMKVGLQGASWVGPDGQPVIPANEGKLKDKISADSDEYYDESEAENEIVSNEEDAKHDNIKDDNDLNKAEEEMDNNDITEKVMDIVKEKEQQAAEDSSEASGENNVEGMFSHLQDNKNVEEIVTNIMDSINQGNAMKEIDEVKEVPSKMELSKSTLENMKEIHMENHYDKPVLTVTANGVNEQQENKEENVPKSEHGINEVDTRDESNGARNSTDLLDNNPKDEFNIEEVFEDSQEKEIQMESVQFKTENTIKAQTDGQMESEDGVMTPIVVLEESTTEKTIDGQESAAITQVDLLQNFNDYEHNNFLEMLQSAEESSTQSITTENNASLIAQKPVLTSGISDISALDNSLTTAATTTAITKTITTTNKPTELNADFVVAATFTNNTEAADGDRFAGEEKDDENSGERDDDDGDDDDDDGDDNSHENGSDYEDEESDETENETNEKPIVFNNETTAFQSNAFEASSKNVNDPKESLQEVANNSNSNESQSAEDNDENTNDEFETEEGEEYDEEYEDYETTTASDSELKTYNSTYCKPVIATLSTNKPSNQSNKNTEMPETATAPSHSLQSVSASTDMIRQTDDKNVLDTKSTNKTLPALVPSTNTVSGNAMPLPLARQLHFIPLHHQPTQLKRRNSHLQHYE